MKNTINLIVTDEEKGQRIDSFITYKETSLSRTRVKRLILNKKLKLNNLISKNPSKRISAGDKIVLEIPEAKKTLIEPYNFKLDISENYFNIYSNSKCLITDTSGTAFTYAFLTKKPVIFFSKNEKLINELGYNKLSYFIDREKIGVITNDLNEISNAIKNIKFIEEKIRVLNDLLEKEIEYLGTSKMRIAKLVDQILLDAK